MQIDLRSDTVTQPTRGMRDDADGTAVLLLLVAGVLVAVPGDRRIVEAVATFDDAGGGGPPLGIFKEEGLPWSRRGFRVVPFAAGVPLVLAATAVVEGTPPTRGGGD